MSAYLTGTSRYHVDDVLTVDQLAERLQVAPSPATCHNAQTLAAAGGPCNWQGADRQMLTVGQLAGCACNACGEWRDYRSADGSPGEHIEDGER
jgi:hypothetical protein